MNSREAGGFTVMDPDANLAEQLRIVQQMTDNENQNLRTDDVLTGRLADLVESLNDWIVKGGALPKAWQR